MSWLTDRKKARQKERELADRLNSNPELAKKARIEHLKRLNEGAKYVCEHELHDNIVDFTNALALVFASSVLAAIFNFDAEKLTKFHEGYAHKAECFRQKLTTLDDMIKYEIRSNRLEYRPTLKWRSYKPEKILDAYEYCKLLRPLKTDQDVVLNYHSAYSATLGQFIFTQDEILMLSALNDYFHFSQFKCQIFVNTFRNMQHSTIRDIYDLIELLEKRVQFAFKSNDLRRFKKHESLWGEILRKDKIA